LSRGLNPINLIDRKIDGPFPRASRQNHQYKILVGNVRRPTDRKGRGRVHKPDELMLFRRVFEKALLSLPEAMRTGGRRSRMAQNRWRARQPASAIRLNCGSRHWPISRRRSRRRSPRRKRGEVKYPPLDKPDNRLDNLCPIVGFGTKNRLKAPWKWMLALDKLPWEVLPADRKARIPKSGMAERILKRAADGDEIPSRLRRRGCSLRYNGLFNGMPVWANALATGWID
jgi:hypothetical protein